MSRMHNRPWGYGEALQQLEQARYGMTQVTQEVHDQMTGDSWIPGSQQRYTQARYQAYRARVVRELNVRGRRGYAGSHVEPPSVALISRCCHGAAWMSTGTFGAWLKALVDDGCLVVTDANSYFVRYIQARQEFEAAFGVVGYPYWRPAVKPKKKANPTQ
jgi:hypothetical protein